MTTIWTYVLLVVGFVLLIKGADFFVEGSSGIAKKLKVPSLIIGLTIVAMGTSLPECAVSVAAAISGNNALAVSNVVGSNIFNLMVVCGFCAVITPLAVGKKTLKQEFPFSVLMAALLLVLGYIGMSVGRIDGVILLIFFALFMFWMVRSALKARTAGITTDASEEANYEFGGAYPFEDVEKAYIEEKKFNAQGREISVYYFGLKLKSGEDAFKFTVEYGADIDKAADDINHTIEKMTEKAEERERIKASKRAALRAEAEKEAADKKNQKEDAPAAVEQDVPVAEVKAEESAEQE